MSSIPSGDAAPASVDDAAPTPAHDTTADPAQPSAPGSDHAARGSRGSSRGPGGRRILRGGALLALLALLAALPFIDIGTGGVLPSALSGPGSLHLLGLCLVFAALALSYDLLFGFSGLLSFGHALFFAAGAYLAQIAMAQFGFGLAAATAFALIGGLVIGVAVGAVSLRVGGIAFAMVTLAFAQAGSIIVNQDPGGVTGGELGQPLAFDKVPDFFVGVVNARNVYWLALALLVVVYVVVTVATRSAPGRIWQAIRENERRVEVLGLRPYSFKLLAFAFACVLAALCGVVYLLLIGGANPSITTPEFTLSLLVMVVLGGAGSRPGVVVGGVLYSYLSQRLPALASSDAVAALPAPLRFPLSEPLFILGLLFVLAILFMPGGIAGALRSVRARNSRTILTAALPRRRSGMPGRDKS